MDPSLHFVSGFVHRRNALYVRAVVRELDVRGVPHAVMLRWRDGQWGRWVIDRRIVDQGVYDLRAGRTVVAVAADGGVQIGDAAGFRWEHVDQSDEGPNGLRHLRAMRRIGDWLYVAGMQRMVYRRPLEGGAWERADQGARVPSDSLEVAGFSAIDGTSANDVYAAGLRGELWRCERGTWRRIELPTNVGLNDLLAVSDDLIYACGHAGVVLVGQGDRWRLVTNDATENGLWGLAWLNERLYLASDQGGLYTVEDDAVEPIDTGLERGFTTFSLNAADGVMLSVGAEDLLLFDGSTWRDLGQPPLHPPGG